VKKCGICGGFFEGEGCPFGVGELPWVEDYALMGKGKRVLAEHQMNVARWVLHGGDEHAENVLAWAKKKMEV
jgi:hypothetical protein